MSTRKGERKKDQGLEEEIQTEGNRGSELALSLKTTEVPVNNLSHHLVRPLYLLCALVAESLCSLNLNSLATGRLKGC